MGKFQGGIEVRLGDFPRAAFKHHHVILVPHVHQVQIALSLFFMGGIGHKLALHASHAHGSQWACPGYVAHHQRRAGANDAQDIRIVLAIRAQQHRLHLHFIIPAFGKQGSNGPVGQPAGEDFLFRGAPFPLEIPAGEFPSRCGFLAVIHRQREEILAFLGLGGGHGGHQHYCVAQLHRHGSIGLLGQFAGFQNDVFASQGGDDFL